MRKSPDYNRSFPIDQLLELIQSNVQYAPVIIFFALLLAGLNIPISEDAMLFISGILAYNNPHYLLHLFFGVFLGAYFSDLIAYSLGRHLGPKLWEIKFFARMVSKEKIMTVSHFFKKYGIITLIVGRFIPFGVRNAIFMTAGLGKMNFTKFALSDLLACAISDVTFFSIYYYFGTSAIEYIKKGNLVIFSIVLIAIGLIVYLRIIKKKKAKKEKKEADHQ